MKELKGVIIPAVTPFDMYGDLSFELAEKNFDAWNKTDVSGYLCLGVEGEYRSLDDDEAEAFVRLASQKKSEDKLLAVGVGRDSLRHTLRFIDRLASCGAEIDYVSVITPGSFSGLISDRPLIKYFCDVADFSPYPVLMVAAPEYVNGVSISGASARLLAEHPNIAGIIDMTDSSPDEYTDCIPSHGDFAVICGKTERIYHALEKGARACVVDSANYMPQEYADLFYMAEKRGLEAVMPAFEFFKNVTQATRGKDAVAGIKCSMNLAGLGGGVPRLPVFPIAPSEERRIRGVLEVNGLLGRYSK